MILDSSVLVAFVLREAGREQLGRAIDDDPVRLVSAATLVEASIVLQNRRGPSAVTELDALLMRLNVVLRAVDANQVEWARIGFERFGKGAHPAALNFGDLFSYALAMSTGEPLLFIRDDFAKTDVPAVEWRGL